MSPKYLWNTDFFEWARKQPDNSINTVITDPPYTSFRNKIGENAIQDKSFNLNEFCDEIIRLLNPKGIFISFCSIHLMKDYFKFFEGKLRFRCEQIWDKRPIRTWISYGLPLRHIEYIVYFGEGELDFSKGEQKKGYKRQQFGGNLKETEKNPKNFSSGQYEQFVNILNFKSPSLNRGNKKNKTLLNSNQNSLNGILNLQLNSKINKRRSSHPTQKPPEFSDYFKKIIKKPGKVLDPCCGTGSLICSFKNALGIDINQWIPVDWKVKNYKFRKLDFY